jgi:hypothetical protein
MIEAPWTAEQVRKLNEYQTCDWVHEFTCPADDPNFTLSHETLGRVLIAKQDGWHCPSCLYRQMWAHDFMFLGVPPNPFGFEGD